MLYIVLINYNNWKDTCACLESILKNELLIYKVLIVDNGSTDDSVKRIYSWANGDLKVIDDDTESFSEYVLPIIKKPIDLVDVGEFYSDNELYRQSKVYFYKNIHNHGFASAMNISLKFIKRMNDASYIWFLGTDSVIDNNEISDIYQRLTNLDKRIGLIGMISMNYYDRAKVQCAGIVEYNKWLGLNYNKFYDRNYEKKDIDSLVINLSKKNAYVYANSMILTKHFFETIEIIPEIYFLYNEELEIMHLLSKAKLNYTIFTDTKVYHKEGRSIGGNSIIKNYKSDFYMIRSRIIYTLRHYPLCILTVYIGLLVSIVRRVIRKQYSRVPMIIGLMINPYKNIDK